MKLFRLSLHHWSWILISGVFVFLFLVVSAFLHYPQIFQGYVSVQPSICGNGVIEMSEACDDGNLMNCDGCSQSCKKESKILKITELMFNPESVDDEDGEYIEIMNISQCKNDLFSFDLYGYLLKTSFWEHAIDKHITVPSGEIRVLGKNKNRFENGGVKVDYEYGLSWHTFNNNGDLVSLYDVQGNYVDKIDYTPFIHDEGESLGVSAMNWWKNDEAEKWCMQNKTPDAKNAFCLK